MIRMKNRVKGALVMGLLSLASLPASSQSNETLIKIYPQEGKNQISKNIYGQFAEHLGTCIYGGIWVGENSNIPNTNGYRNESACTTLAGRLLCRRISLDGRHRAERATPENGE